MEVEPLQLRFCFALAVTKNSQTLISLLLILLQMIYTFFYVQGIQDVLVRRVIKGRKDYQDKMASEVHQVCELLVLAVFLFFFFKLVFLILCLFHWDEKGPESSSKLASIS